MAKGVDARPECILDALGAMRMRSYPLAPPMRLLHSSGNLFVSVLCRAGILAGSRHAPGHPDNFDTVYASTHMLADCLDHLVHTVCFASTSMDMSTGWSKTESTRNYTRPRDQALTNGVTKVNIQIIATTYVTYRGIAGEQRSSGSLSSAERLQADSLRQAT